MLYVKKLSFSLLALACAVWSPLWSQSKASNESEIDELATRTVERVAKTQAHRVLVITTQGCLLDPDICGSLDQKVRAELQKRVPGVQLFSRGDILPLLAKHGLLPVDGYTSAAELVAPDLGAEVMVSESLKWIQQGYEAQIRVADLVKHKDVDDIKAKLARPASDSGTEPIILREPSDGPAVVVPRGDAKSAQARWFPSCEKCPEPQFTDEARAKRIEGIVVLVVTITEQGAGENISIVRALGGGLTDAAVEAVRRWRFKPAVGPDGKPFATRVPIEVRFRLQGA
jgi:TonB family protein